MERERLQYIMNGNDLPDAQAFAVLERITGVFIGSNLSIQFTHALTEKVMQSTFDAKHGIAVEKETKWHYSKPISIIHLNKNKSEKILVLYHDRSIGTCSKQEVKKLWEDSECVGFRHKPIVFIEDSRFFVRDLFGAYLHHNICKKFCENPSQLVFVQCFHTAKDKHVLPIARHTASKLKDMVSAVTFESIEKQIENNVNKKQALLEDYSRDLLGLPLIVDFELIYDEFQLERDFENDLPRASGWHGGDLGHCGKISGENEKRTGRLAARLRGGGRGGFTLLASNIRGRVLSIVSRTRAVLQKYEYETKRRPHPAFPSCVRVQRQPQPLVNTFFDAQSRWSQLNLKNETIRRHFPLRPHMLPSRVKLTRIHFNSRYVRSLQCKMHLNDYKKLVLANTSRLVPKSILKPDYGESKLVRTKHFSLHCGVCDFKNTHKTRRKAWKCTRCKTEYTSTIATKPRENNLKNLLNENVFVYTEKAGTIVPSPIKSAHCARTMCDALKKELEDAPRSCFTPTPKLLKKCKESVLQKKEVASQKLKQAAKATLVPSKKALSPKYPWYRYTHQIPIVYGSCIDHLKGGKENVFRKKIGTKICQESTRLTVTCDPDLKANQIGIPRTVWKSIGYPKSVCMVRYPSISKFNLSFHDVVPFDSDRNNFAITAHAPPTVCSGHNMDFDGDAVTLKALSRLTAYELEASISPEHSFMEDGRMRVNFSSDAKLGLGFGENGDNSEPLHLVLERLIRKHYVVTGSSSECYRLFQQFEDEGRKASAVCQGVDKDKVYEYIFSQFTKLNEAHYFAIRELHSGMDRQKFLEQSTSTRMGILETPLNASDNGMTVAILFTLLPQAKVAYDYSLRTANGNIVTVHSLEFSTVKLEPITYSIPRIKNKLLDGFKPLCYDIDLIPVELPRLGHPVFDSLLGDYIRLKELVSKKKLPIQGRLYYSSLMVNLNLKLNTTYIAYFRSIDDSWTSYTFQFQK